MVTYHSNGETAGHWTYIYCPLLYMNWGGLDICNARTFPG